jgi:hypothetical protein
MVPWASSAVLSVGAVEAAPPVTLMVDFAVVAPGQYSVYSPAVRFREKLPEKPGARFSFSPTIRSPESSSNSVTPVASLFLIAKLSGPEV